MGVDRPRDGQPHLVPSSWDPSGYVTGRLWTRVLTAPISRHEGKALDCPCPHLPCLITLHRCLPRQHGSDLPHTLGLNLRTITVTLPRAGLLRSYILWKCHTIQEWLNEIGVQSISGVTTNERKVKKNRPDRGNVMLNWAPYLGICQVTQKFSFVIRETERCVIFHHIQWACF